MDKTEFSTQKSVATRRAMPHYLTKQRRALIGLNRRPIKLPSGTAMFFESFKKGVDRWIAWDTFTGLMVFVSILTAGIVIHFMRVN